MDNTFVHEDLNAVIRQHSEWLANQLHSQRESLFPPDAEKTMRKFTSGEAAALLGVNDLIFANSTWMAKGLLPSLPPATVVFTRRRISRRCVCSLKKPLASRAITFPDDEKVIIFRSSA